MRHLASLLLASAAFTAEPSARAAADDPGPTLPAPPTSRYYGWQNIIVGYTGLGLMAHGFFSDSNALLLTGAATWTLGGAVVHGAHGNAGAAAASPFVTGIASLALIALAASSRDTEGLAFVGAAYALASPVIDGALARDDNPDRDVPIFIRAGLGVSRFRARQPAAGDGVLASTTTFGTGIELTVGGHFRNVVIAGSLLEHIVTFDQFNDWRVSTPLTGSLSMTHVTLGPTVEWHREKRGGTFVGGTVGLAHFARRTDDAPMGYAIAAHAGYDFVAGPRSSIGLSFRVLYSSMSTTDYGGSRVQLFAPSVNLSYAYR